MTTIAIIGASASGYMAAVSAAKLCAEQSGGANSALRIILLERMDRACKKLMATGNGRCNLTNTNAAAEAAEHYYSTDIDNAAEILHRFTPSDTIAQFSEMGLLCRTETDGRVYPSSNQASSVVDVLRLTAAEYGVIEECGFDVIRIKKKHDGFKIISSDGREVTAQRVIVSTGGRSGNNLGCNGSGYDLLQALGHSKTATFPVLVPIKCKSPIPKILNGVRFYGTVTIVTSDLDGEPQHQCLRISPSKSPSPPHSLTQRGEIQFTEYGVSGIAVMQLSRIVGQQQLNGKAKELFISLDFLPDIPYHELISHLKQRAVAHHKRAREDFLTGLVNKKIGQMIMKPFSNGGNTGFMTKDFKLLASVLKDMRLPIQETLSWQQSQVTAGGIRLSEFDSRTLESKLCSGLYVVGELLDVDGDCGGYNLQWAWATGYLAGKAAVSGFTFA